VVMLNIVLDLGDQRAFSVIGDQFRMERLGRHVREKCTGRDWSSSRRGHQQSLGS
jgi:hypothetical protein